MARSSYMARRDGRYFIQIRFASKVALLVGRPLYRASLQTSEYRLARLRLSECLGWIHRMNDSTDYATLFQKNVVELSSYLQDPWPLSEERLFARKSYEELLKNLNRRAQAAGCAPDMIDQNFPALLTTFVQQNVEAEAYLQKAERVREYERGRTDMQAAVQFGAAPDSFRRSTANGQSFPNPMSTSRSQPAPTESVPPLAENFEIIDRPSQDPVFRRPWPSTSKRTRNSAGARTDGETSS